MKRENFYIVFAILQVISDLSAAENYSFLVAGDPQYLAEKSKSPKQLDPYSEKANNRAIALLKNFSGRSIPEDHGGGKVSEKSSDLSIPETSLIAQTKPAGITQPCKNLSGSATRLTTASRAKMA